MKKLFGFFAVLAVFAAVCSCDMFPLPDNPDSGDDGKVEDGGQVDDGEAAAPFEKVISRITYSEEDNSSELVGGIPCERSAVMEYEYDSEMRLTEYVSEYIEGDEYNRGRSTRTFDYCTKGELRVVTETGSVDSWGEDTETWYYRYLLDDEGRVTTVWRGTSTFSDMSDYEKIGDFSYSKDGRLSAMTQEDRPFRFIYTDGLMTSVEIEYEGEMVETQNFSSNYPKRYPAKGQFANYMLWLHVGAPESYSFMDPLMAGCLGKMSDCLLEGGLFASYDSRPYYSHFEREPNVRYHVSTKEIRHQNGAYILDFEYTFDSDGYVTKIIGKEAFDIMQVEYDVVGDSTPNEYGLYECHIENYSATKIDSFYDYQTYEIEYL